MDEFDFKTDAQEVMDETPEITDEITEIEPEANEVQEIESDESFEEFDIVENDEGELELTDTSDETDSRYLASQYLRDNGFEKAADYVEAHYDDNYEFSPDEPIHILTRNSDLEGTSHSETGVPFERGEFELAPGVSIEGVYPRFETIKTVDVTDEMRNMPLHEQFQRAKETLQDTMFDDKEFMKSVTFEQMDALSEPGCYAPKGFTPHHDPLRGPYSISYVDSEIHRRTGHTGTNSLL